MGSEIVEDAWGVKGLKASREFIEKNSMENVNKNKQGLQLRYWNCQGRAQPARYALIEAGYPFDDHIMDINGGNGGTKPMGDPPLVFWPAVLKPNREFSGPHETLPCLRHGDFLLNQTVAITEYACEVCGYGPKTAQERAKVAMICQCAYEDVMVHELYATADVEPPVNFFGGTYTADGAVRERKAKQAGIDLPKDTYGGTGGVPHKLRLFEHQIQGPFFLGANLSAADFMVMTVVDWAHRIFGDKVFAKCFEDCPKLMAHYALMFSRPNIKRYVESGKRPYCIGGVVAFELYKREDSNLAEFRKLCERLICDGDRTVLDLKTGWLATARSKL